jgi:hypothetical protein
MAQCNQRKSVMKISSESENEINEMKAVSMAKSGEN